MMSATHRPHPLESDPEDAVLYDNCERCDQHAEDLSGIDNDNLQRIRDRHRDGVNEITINERRARNLIDAAYQVVIRIDGGRRHLEEPDDDAKGEPNTPNSPDDPRDYRWTPPDDPDALAEALGREILGGMRARRVRRSVW